MANRWVERRLSEIGKKKADLARALGLRRPDITKIIDGTRRIQATEVPIIAQFLEWPVSRVHAMIAGQAAAALPPNIDPAPIDTLNVRVMGAVQGGLFREAIEWPFDKQYDIAIPASVPYAKSHHLQGLEVIGPSMNRLYPEGSVVIVVPSIELGEGWLPKTGQRVIVQRRNQWGDYEATVKEVEIKGRELVLWPRSDHPEFQKPWTLDMPEMDGVAEAQGENMRIVGLVVASWRSEPSV